MESGVFRFDSFVLDLDDRQLSRDGVPLELSGRYLDALALMLAESGRLVSKDRFMDEVWRGVPVTDEALTQCVRSLRKVLGDDATRPRFIETVPKYGYRFVASVEVATEISPSSLEEGEGVVAERSEASDVERSLAVQTRGTTTNPSFEKEGLAIVPMPIWFRTLLLACAGMIGGGFAGMLGGIVFAFTGVTQPLAPGMGSISVLLVLMSLCIVVGLAGGLGVGAGIAFAALRSDKGWHVALGGALGGLVVGAVVKLLGVDAFNLLLGQSPAGITGAREGLMLGGAIGLGLWFGGWQRLRRSSVCAAIAGGAAGAIIALTGGRLMGGSLQQLASLFPESRLQMAQVGALFGETSFGIISQTITATCEGTLFAGSLAAAMILARRQLDDMG